MSTMYIPEMPVTNAINELANIYIPLIKGNMPYSSIPSPFLWGPPGVGKSDGINELAEVLEEETGKKVKVTDIRLLLFSPIDLRGVPAADESRQFTDWLKPRILDLDPADNVVNILFLDELSAAPQSVQAAAYQLTLNRSIGEHKLPDNTLVMAAGNRTTDRAVAYRMPSALANRMMHYEICVDFKTWAKWAIEKGDIHPYVLGYLSYDMSKLYITDKSIDEVAFPTPRSWMFVSNILNTLGEIEDIGKCHAIISSCVGMGTAVEFIAWCKVYKDLPKTEDIFNGKAVSYPNSPDALYALIGSMTTYAVRRENETEANGLTISEIENVCKFCANIPADYAMSFYLNIFGSKSIQMKLMKSPTFIEWGKRHKRALASAGYSIA